MKREHGLRLPWIPLLVALAAALSGRAAQAGDPIILNQSFELRYDRWQTTQQESITTEDATYDFVVGAPVGSYRLGSVAFLGTVGYDRLTLGKDSSASAGLNRYGIRVFLFPYRRFHLSFDYAHQQSPSFFGSARMKSDVYGFEYRLRNFKWPNLRVAFRHGDSTLLENRETWNLWTVEGDQTMGRTYYTFQIFRQDMLDSVSGSGWAIDSLNARADTRLGGGWKLQNYLSASYFSGNTDFELGSSLWGPLGAWTSGSDVSLNVDRGPGGIGLAAVLSQSLSRTSGPITYFGSANLVAERASGRESAAASISNNIVSLQGGALWQFAPSWSVVGDASLLAGARNPLTGATGLAYTVHAGIIQGGDLPGFLRHSLFFLSDLSFNHHINQEYPPGYVPSELAEQLVQRRLRQQGGLDFAADFWHSQAQGGGRQDWFRVTGTLRVSTRFRMLVIADWRKDDHYTFLDRRREDEDVTANATYTFGRSVVSASTGYFKTDDTLSQSAVTGLLLNRKTVYGSVGFNSALWKIPYGFLVSRYDQGDGNPLTTYSLYSSLQYRRISLRVLYDFSKRADGWSSSRISVDLMRVFDSLILWGSRMRR